MKKLLSIVLALVLVLSSITALATERRVLPPEDKNAEMTIYNGLESRYDSDSTTATETAAAPSVNTEIWLQVEASGQIDVTVPLVLVFKTNIDGGNATAPSTYGITNNSTADVVVTEIKVTEKSEGKMTLAEYAETITAEDTYGVTLDAPKHGATSVGDIFKNVAEKENDTASVSALNGGLIWLEKKPADTDGTFSPFTLKMTTGPLSFVTKHIDKDGEEVLDETQGVHLLTLTYTVAIDKSNGVGDSITKDGELFKAPATNP